MIVKGRGGDWLKTPRSNLPLFGISQNLDIVTRVINILAFAFDLHRCDKSSRGFSTDDAICHLQIHSLIYLIYRQSP